jgi:hypothetical protein
MKRRFLVLGMAIMAGMPGMAFAKSTPKEGGIRDYTAWNSVYSPHYGRMAAAHPLMDHMEAWVSRAAQRSGGEIKAVRLEFNVPEVAHGLIPEPALENDRRIGVALRFTF